MLSPIRPDSPARDLIVSLMRDEKRRLEELVTRMESGLLSDAEAQAGLKHLEMAVRCLRYQRFDCGLHAAEDELPLAANA